MALNNYPIASLRKRQHVADVGTEYIGLHYVFGADLTRISNLSFVEDDVIAYISGAVVVFQNIVSGQKEYLLGIDESGIGCITIHPSRTKFAVGGRGYQPNIYIYDYPSKNVIRILKNGTERAYASLSFNETGDKLASVGSFPDYMLTTWDWEMERIILHCKAFGQDVFSVRFSQDDERRLVTSGTGHIRFWKMVATFTGQKLQGSIGKFGKIELSDIVAFVELPDGKVVSGTESGSLLLWEGNFIKCRFVNVDGSLCHKGSINHIDLDRDAGCVLSAGADGYMRWWSFAVIDSAEVDSDQTMDFPLVLVNEYFIGNGCGIRSFIYESLSDQTRFVIHDTSGRLLLVTYDSSTHRVNNSRGIPSNSSVEALELFPSGVITAVDVSPVMHIAATAGRDGAIRLWDYINRTELFCRMFSSPVTCLSWGSRAVDQNGRTIVAGFADGIVRVFQMFKKRNNVDEQEEKDTFELYNRMLFKPHTAPLTDVSYSLDGKVCLTASEDGTVFIFDMTTAEDYGTYTPLRFFKVSEVSSVYCRKLSWRNGMSRNLICSCSDGVGREFDLSIINRFLGDRDGVQEILSFDITIVPTEISLKIPAPLASSASTASVGPGSPSKEGAQGDKAAVSSQSETAATTTSQLIPVKLNCLLEDSAGKLYAGGSTTNTNMFCQVNEFSHTMSDLPVGLYSKDGKSFPKHPSITCIRQSKTSQLLLIGAQDGSVVVKPKDFPEVFVRIVAHNEQCGGVTDVICSFDDAYLLSVGRDGILVVNRMKPSKIICDAESLAKDIRASVYEGQSIVKELPKFQPAEPKFLTRVIPFEALEGFSELPLSLFMDELTAENINSVNKPDVKEPAEMESGAYSIQESKLKSADDARKITAEDKKNNVRKLVKQLQREYSDIKTRSQKMPAEVRVSEEEFIVDRDYFRLLREQGTHMESEAHLECEYNAVRAATLRRKLTDRLMDRLLVEDMRIKGFKSSGAPIVHSLRTRDLDSSVWNALQSIREAVRQEEVEAAKLKSHQSMSGESVTKSKHGAASVSNSVNEGSLTLASAAGGLDATGTAVVNRSEKRKTRKQEISRHLVSKPREDEDDARDVEAISTAEKTIGSYKLKIADDYQVPENLRINAEKKKRQIVMLEDSIMSLRLQFNERFLGLRTLKRRIIDDLNTDKRRIAVIEDELEIYGKKTEVSVFSHDPLEYPDDRDEVTSAEMEHFRPALAKSSFNKVIPLPHSTITGTKTVINNKQDMNFGSNNNRSSAQLQDIATLMTENMDISSEELPQVDNVLSKFYPDEIGLDVVERLVPVLQVMKQNLSQVTKHDNSENHKPRENHLASERRRMLLFERSQLITKASKNTAMFDEALDDLRFERHVLVANIKQAELKLIILFQEYLQLLTFETRDNSLQQKQLKCMREKAEIIAGTLDLQAKMELKLDEMKSWASKGEQVLEAFNTLVPASHPFVEPLTKIFRKKIKRSKNNANAGDGDEDFEEEEEEDDDDDLDDEEVEDICPVGCDNIIYEKVLDSREKRLDIDEVMTDVVKIVDDLKKSLDRLKSREKQIDKDAKSTESEIQQFQLQKQLALNQIDIYVPLHISQIYTFSTSGNLSQLSDSKPEENNDTTESAITVNSSSETQLLSLVPSMTSKSHVLLKDSSLVKLQQRIGELNIEIDTAKVDLMQLHKEKGVIQKQREAQRELIDTWKEKVDELMSMKFGRIVDLDDLEKGSDHRLQDTAEKELQTLEQGFEQELSKLSTAAFELKTKIAESTLKNTELLNKVADLSESRLHLTRELNVPSGGGGNAQKTSGMALDETSDKHELMSFSKMQLRELESLRNEITCLRRKDAPLLLSATMPAPPHGRLPQSAMATSKPSSSLPPIPVKRSNASR